MEDSVKDDTKQCFVFPLIRNSIFSSNCNGEFLPVTKLRTFETGTKKSEIAVILDRCGIFDEEQTNFIFPDQQICEHHRKIMYKNFKVYIHREKCMWKDHRKVDPRRRKISLNKVKSQPGFGKNLKIAKEKSKNLLKHFNWLIPYDGMVCLTCQFHIAKLMKCCVLKYS